MQKNNFTTIPLASMADKIRERGYTVKGWCRTRDFDVSLFYMVINGKIGNGRKKVSRQTDRLISQLKAEGFIE